MCCDKSVTGLEVLPCPFCGSTPKLRYWVVKQAVDDEIDGAISLVGYVHPELAFYIFGPEDGTLKAEITDWCRDIIYIPTNRCMNLAATVNVVLYYRLAKCIKRKVCND